MRRSRLVGVLVTALLLSTVAAGGGTVAVSVSDGPDERPTVEASQVAGQNAQPVASGVIDGAAVTSVRENNTTRHVHPDEADDEGDLDALEGFLSDGLGEQLDESAVQINEAEYELAREVLGEEYDDDLGRYVEVADELGDEEHERAGEAFGEAQETQQEYAETRQEFEETYEEYRAAKEAGDEERARELARELDALAQELEELEVDLQELYDEIEEATGVDLSDAREAIDETQRGVSETQRDVQAEEFVETELSLAVDSPDVSFLEPMRASGALVDEDGEPLGDQQVQFQIGDQGVGIQTDENGTFELAYRPTTLPTGEQEVTVEYVPRSGSEYLGSTDTVRVDVVAVEPTIDVLTAPDRAAFGDEIETTGTVEADDIPASGLPVVVSIGGVEVGAGETDSDGQFSVRGELPAAVPSGDQPLEVGIPDADHALTGSSPTQELRIEETRTDLEVDGEQFEGERVRANGTLVAAHGTPIEGEPLEITVEGERVGTVQTGTDGTFEAVLEIPSEVLSAEESRVVTLTATFAAEGTNLEESTATTDLRLAPPPGDGADGGPDAADPFGVALALGVGVVVVIGTLVAWRRGGWKAIRERGWWPIGARERSEGDTPELRSEETTPVEGSTPAEEGAPDQADSLVRARGLVAEDRPTVAIERAYGTVRNELGDALNVERTRTHWEFFTACEAAGLNGARRDALEVVLEGYERAAFAPDPVPSDAADRVIEAASTLQSTGSDGR